MSPLHQQKNREYLQLYIPHALAKGIKSEIVKELLLRMGYQEDLVQEVMVESLTNQQKHLNSLP
ncbi:hypothetical protein HYW21_09125 [Candidatus Woesearchaeota archaeon]|nr:hypothetical protein [Candidatus Woesearchaeota archaeon]